METVKNQIAFSKEGAAIIRKALYMYYVANALDKKPIDDEECQLVMELYSTFMDMYK